MIEALEGLLLEAPCELALGVPRLSRSQAHSLATFSRDEAKEAVDLLETSTPELDDVVRLRKARRTAKHQTAAFVLGAQQAGDRVGDMDILLQDGRCKTTSEPLRNDRVDEFSLACSDLSHMT